MERNMIIAIRKYHHCLAMVSQMKKARRETIKRIDKNQIKIAMNESLDELNEKMNALKRAQIIEQQFLDLNIVFLLLKLYILIKTTTENI